jgi:hypothetical protein
MRGGATPAGEVETSKNLSCDSMAAVRTLRRLSHACRYAVFRTDHTLRLSIGSSPSPAPVSRHFNAKAAIDLEGRGTQHPLPTPRGVGPPLWERFVVELRRSTSATAPLSGPFVTRRAGGSLSEGPSREWRTIWPGVSDPPGVAIVAGHVASGDARFGYRPDAFAVCFRNARYWRNCRVRPMSAIWHIRPVRDPTSIGGYPPS